MLREVRKLPPPFFNDILFPMSKKRTAVSNVKIGRNAPCPCGSGRKHKHCCIGYSFEEIVSQKKLAQALIKADADAQKSRRILCCLHPNHNECSERIIRAHAIQNNRILRKLAENGEVITFNETEHHLFQTNKTAGRKVATTFTGFCAHHDKILFQEIEDRPFSATEKQVFLFTYRTFAWHLHKKRVQAQYTEAFSKSMEESGYSTKQFDEADDYKRNVLLGVADNDEKKAIFDQALLAECYDIIDYCVWEIPNELQIALSMMNEMQFDLERNPINAGHGDAALKSIFLNIVPLDSKTYIIWSWLKKDREYREFVRQFMNLSERDRFNYLNNMIPIWTDSLVMSPALWESWGDQVQEAYRVLMNSDMLIHQHELEDQGHAYEYMDTPWDLFVVAEN